MSSLLKVPEFTGFKSDFFISVLVDLQHVFNYVPQMGLQYMVKLLQSMIRTRDPNKETFEQDEKKSKNIIQ